MSQQIIYDLGSNKGEDTEYYLRLGYSVVSVDGNPDFSSHMQSRFGEEIRSGQLTHLNLAVGESDGEVDFYVCDDKTEWSSVFEMDRGLDTRKIRVPQSSLQPILKKHGPAHYIKIDIEGNDVLCLSQLTKESAPQYISLECGPIEEMIELLTPLGYRKFKLISQFHFLPIQSNAPVRYAFAKAAIFIFDHLDRIPNRFRRPVRLTGEFFDRKSLTIAGTVFARGSTGPFGNDAPGQWVDSTTLLRRYGELRERFARRKARTPLYDLPEYSLWMDLHAARD